MSVSMSETKAARSRQVGVGFGERRNRVMAAVINDDRVGLMRIADSLDRYREAVTARDNDWCREYLIKVDTVDGIG